MTKTAASEPAIASARAAVKAFPFSITLPTGLVVVQQRPLKGRDGVAAQRICGKESTDFESTAALIAQVITMNGTQSVMEDILEMDLEDMTDLADAVVGKSLASTRKPS